MKVSFMNLILGLIIAQHNIFPEKDYLAYGIVFYIFLIIAFYRV